MHLAAQFDRQEEAGFPLLIVRGRVGTGDVALFEANLLDLQRSARDCALLDLTDCPYLTSRAFPLILQTSKEMRVKGFGLFLSVGPDIRELLEVLRLESRLSVFLSRSDSVAAARAHLEAWKR